jgi:hypothetical protein
LVDFIEPSAGYDREYLIGRYARRLVHEATHGELFARGIPYEGELRPRVERLCVREEQRFVLHLTFTHPDLAERLYREFDPSLWKWSWTATPFQRLVAQIKRIFEPPAPR